MEVMQSAPDQFWVIEKHETGAISLVCGPFETRSQANQALRECEPAGWPTTAA